MKLLGIISIYFDITGQLLIMYSAFVRYLTQYENRGKQSISYFIDFKKAYDLFRKEVLHNITLI
jgi:hypothetical protein